MTAEKGGREKGKREKRVPKMFPKVDTDRGGDYVENRTSVCPV